MNIADNGEEKMKQKPIRKMGGNRNIRLREKLCDIAEEKRKKSKRNISGRHEYNMQQLNFGRRCRLV